MVEHQRKHVLLTAALVCLSFGSTGCGKDEVTPPPTPCQQKDDIHAADWVPCRLKDMTLEEKVGQLFMTYAYGEQAADPNASMIASNQKDHGVDNAEQLISRYHLGGIIYFTWSNNLNNPRQISALSRGLQQVAMRQAPGIPLLIATDQEHGVVTRVGEPVTQFPGSMALGATRRLQDAHEAARITGRELRALGINQNFGPVADVNSNPLNPVIGVRSFGVDPALVSGFVQTQIRGMQAGGIAASAKHFPGHGDTDVDSHFGLPIISRSTQQLDAVDLPPFVAAIDAGVDAIMSAHIVVPSLDASGLPATLSRPILTDLLRGQLGYTGVVVSDSLAMAGARPFGDESDARVPVEALKAGVDLLLMPPKIDVAYNAVLAAVRGGELSQERLDEAVGRILALKQKRGLLAEPLVDEAALAQVGAASHLDAAESITARSITLLRNDARVLPLKAPVSKVLVTGWGVATTAALGEELSKRWVSAQVLQTGIAPAQSAIDQAVAAAEQVDVVVVLTSRAWENPSQLQLVSALRSTQKPVVVVSVREPYDVGYLGDAPTVVATYGYRPVSMRALAKVLLGVINPTGLLPVNIPEAGKPSSSLYPIGYGLSYPIP
ncbi:glycoside hydrolase family 3 C-terminal domain-containing protein [Archangium violaceum]|uniref:glycoside hydrolase family 3 protein n=1 Tax=Archangium violaceum TaxID=83451 RepID=UPI001950D8E8|nr:glycoside hydrolase family 3 protein [Archangium violaceum]QRN96249.1 glycoside hydrolase family 3 C-terminal domain-containing protein [Archangium violaceum]